MLSNDVIQKWNALEIAAEKAGGYVIPPTRPIIMDYDYPAMSKYAAKKGVTSLDLTNAERNKFKFDPPLIYD